MRRATSPGGSPSSRQAAPRRSRVRCSACWRSSRVRRSLSSRPRTPSADHTVRLSPQTSRARPLLARCGRLTLPAPAAPSQSAPSRLTRPGRLPSQPCPRRPAAARGERGHGRGACQHVNHSRAVDRTGTARHGPARTTGAGCRCGCRHRAAGFGDPVACSSMSFPTALDLARLRRQLMAGAGCCYPRRPRSASLPASCWSHGWFRRPSWVLPDRCCCSPRCCACSPRTAWCDRHTP